MRISPQRPLISAFRSTTKTIRASRTLLRVAILVGLVSTAAVAFGSTSSASNLIGPWITRAATILGVKQSAPEAKVAETNRVLHSEETEALETLSPSAMAVERRGHSATRLSDGRVLIAGGENSTGVLNQTEIYDPGTSEFSVASNMNETRVDHTATLLSDGRVLVAGGRNGAGSVNTTEIYDPTNATFISGPTMSVARAGHSATLFADGRILFAGGTGSGSAEIMDAALSGSTAVGSLAIGRSMHSATLLVDGRVLVIGGRDGASDLSSGEIFDTPSGTFSTIDGTLTVGRARAHLRVLFDGKVQIIGGSNDGSMEIYDPMIETFGAYAHVVPETDPCPGLHSHVLASQARAALFYNGQSDPLFDRSGHTITELNGHALVIGGANSNGAFLSSSSILTSSSASISTDKLDYAPGETATISGRGFQAGETVRVKIHEDPHTPQERGFDVVADADGNFTGTYLVMDYDLNMKFVAGGRGLTSGRTAQTTFTDAVSINSITVLGSQIPNPVIQGNSATYGSAASNSIRVDFNGNSSTCIATLSVSAGLPSGATATFSPTTLSASTAGNQFSLLTISTTAATPSGSFTLTLLASGNPGCSGSNRSVTTTFVVGPPTATSLVFAEQPTNADKDDVIAPPVTVRIEDGSGNLVTASPRNVTLAIGTNPSGGTLSGTTTVAAVGGIATFNDLAINKAGNGYTLIASSLTPGPALTTATSNSFNINKLNQTISFGALAVKTYGDAAFNVSASGGASGLPVTFVAAPAAVCTSGGTNGETITIAGADLCTVTASQAGNSDYNAATDVPQSFIVNKATLNVTADNVTRDYGDANPTFTVSYTGFKNSETLATSGVTGAPSLTTTATAQSGVGPYTITAAVGTLASGNYNFSFANGTLTVDPRTATVTANPKSKFYGEANPALDATVVGEVAGGDPINHTLVTSATQFSNVGGYPITVTLGANPNYSVTPTNGTLTINQAIATVTANPKSKFYGEANPALDAVVVGEVAGGDPINYSLATTATQFSNIGGYDITVTLGSNPNYSVTKTDGTLSINQAVATVTANNKTKTYGDVNPALDAVVVGEVVGGDPINYTLATTATQFSNIGGYDITVTLGSNPNYSVTKTDGTLSINQAVATVTANNKSKFYGEANPALDATVVGAVVGGDPINYSLATTATQFSNIGGYSITVTLGANPNYSVTPTNGTLTINQAVATVTANNKTKTYGEANSALDAVVASEVAGGDPINYTLATTATQFSNVGDYPINVTLGSNPNYSVTKTDATLTIEQRALAITAVTKTKTYDSDVTAAAVPTVSGLQGTDTVTGLVETYDTKHVGSGKTLSVTAYTVNDGNGGNNYIVSTVNDTSGVILQAPLTITAVTNTKTYDSNNTAAGIPTVSGLQGTDSVTGLSETYDNKNAGTSKTLSVVTFTVVDGNSGNNYIVSTLANTTGVINQAGLTITAVTNTKIYDGTNNAAGVPTVSGLQGTDTVTGQQETYDTKHFGTGKTLAVSAYTVNDGNGGDNYIVTLVPHTTGAITQRPISVTAVTSTKMYDGNTSSLGVPTVTPGTIASGDTANFTQTYDTQFVGTGKTLTPAGTVTDGNSGNNYQNTYVPVSTGVITTSFCFNGFLSPIGGSVETSNGGSFIDPVRAFKLGSTIPVKFAINSLSGTTCGAPVITGIHRLEAIYYSNSMDFDQAIDATPTDAATTGNQFRLTDGQWHFNLSTKGNGFKAGTWLLRATLQDGSLHTVWISIKK